MKMTILCMGKSHPDFIKDGVGFYLKKLGHLCSIEWKEILPKHKTEQEETILHMESELFFKQIHPSDWVILLDEKGRGFESSRLFSEYINKKRTSGTKSIAFLIGGAFGFDQRLYDRANEKISLATMTYSHQNIRLIFLEQLYRAYSILHHLPYHHE